MNKKFVEVHTLPQDENGQIVQEGIGQKLFINADHIVAFFVHAQYGRTTIQTVTGAGYIIRETLKELQTAINRALK